MMLRSSDLVYLPSFLFVLKSIFQGGWLNAEKLIFFCFLFQAKHEKFRMTPGQISKDKFALLAVLTFAKLIFLASAVPFDYYFFNDEQGNRVKPVGDHSVFP